MAAIASPLKITYGSQAVGGSSGVFQITNAYREGLDHDQYFLEFDVQVIGSSRSDLQDQCDTLEAAFRKRDQTLKIDVDNVADPDGSSLWTYTTGEDLLNIVSAIDKSGSPDTDHGLTRQYTIRIEGELPSLDVLTASGIDHKTGLREIEYSIRYEPGRQKVVTMSGVYTSTPATSSPVRSAQTARQNYEDTTTNDTGTGADQEWTAYSARWAGDTFELVSEDAKEDRNTHTLEFSRTYKELLDNQSDGTLDDTSLRDHTFTFDEGIDQPGDFLKDTVRLRTVTAQYDCYVDIESGTSLDDAFDQKIKPHILARFKAKFSPKTFCIIRRQVRYDRTAQRLSASLTFQYQKSGGTNIIQMRGEVRVSFSPGHELTPMHEANPFAVEVDIGFATRTRETTLFTMFIGEQPPDPVGPHSGGKGAGSGGPVTLDGGGPGVAESNHGKPGGLGGGNRGNIIDARDRLQYAFDKFGDGGGSQGKWIVIDSDLHAVSYYMGDPDEEEQLLITESTERRVEQYVEQPSGRA